MPSHSYIYILLHFSTQNSEIKVNIDFFQVVELKTGEGLTLYGFYKIPPLDVMITWSESYTTILPFRTHEVSFLRIDFILNVISSSSFVSR